MRRQIEGGYELDDDPARLDLDAIWAFLSRQAYWGRTRTRDLFERQVHEAARVMGLYYGEEQIGFERAFTDGMVVYLADVYVLSEHRGRGLGAELVRMMVDEGPLRDLRWLLHTLDAHGLYEKFGFGPPSERMMERPPPRL